MTRCLLIIGIVISGYSVSAQELQFTNPVKMGDNINSQYEESNPLLSPDGKVLYFVRTNDPENTGGEEGGQDIWYSTLENGHWSEAKNDLSAINNGDNNAVVGVADHNNKLFLINTYSAHPRRDRGVVFTARNDDDKWIAPRELDLILKMKSDFYGFYMTPEEDVLLISMKGKQTLGEEDLYVSFRNADSTWTNPLHMGGVINSDGFEISPFLSADHKTLYFASNGFDGLGSADIYKTKRLDDSWENWSKPENMGKDINSEAFDAYFSIYEDKAFFASNRESKSADLYAIGIEIPEPEKPIAEAPKNETDEKEAEVEKTPVEEEAEEKEVKPFSKSYVVYFPFDDSGLTEESKSTLNEAVEELQQNNFNKIKITGYTDSMGPEAYNQQLSEKRAKSVADFLQSKGIQVENTNVDGLGEDDPIASNKTRTERKQNRRVEVEVE